MIPFGMDYVFASQRNQRSEISRLFDADQEMPDLLDETKEIFSSFLIETPIKDFISYVQELPNSQRRVFIKEKLEQLLADNKHTLAFEVNDQLFAHILSAHIISNTELEGMPYYDSISYFLSMFSKIKLSIPCSQTLELLIKNFKTLAFIDNELDESTDQASVLAIVDWVRKEIVGLSPGQSLLTPAGWDQHAMLFEVVKQSNGTFLLRVFNTGGGVEFHAGGSGAKNLVQCYIEISQIAAEKILSPIFWERVFDIHNNKYKEGEKADHTDIYKKLLFFLGGELRTANDRQITTTAQFSGVCTSKVLKSYLKFYFGEEAFRSIIFQIEFWTFANYYAKVKDDLTKSRIELLSWAKEKLNRDALNLLKLYKKKSSNKIKDEFFRGSRGDNESIAFIEDLLKLISLDESLKLKAKPVQRTASPSLSKWLKDQKLIYSSRQNRFKFKPTKNEVFHESGTRATQPSGSSVGLRVSFLESWNDYLTKNRFEFTACFHAINQLLGELPIPDGSQKIFSERKNFTTTLINLRHIAFTYVTAATKLVWNLKPESFDNHLKIYLNFCHLFALMDEAARASLPKEQSIAEFGLHLPFLDLLFNPSEKFDWEDEKTTLRFVALKEYYKKRNANKELKLFAYPFTGESLKFEVNLASLKRFGDFAFLGKYLKDNPRVEKRLKRMHPEASSVYLLSSLFVTPKMMPDAYLRLRELALLFQSYNPEVNIAVVNKNVLQRFFCFEALPTAEAITIRISRKKPEKATSQESTKDERVLSFITCLSSAEQRIKALNFLKKPKAPLIQALEKEKYTQNQGLCGQAKNLSNSKLDEVTAQKLIEIFSSDSLRLHHCLSLFSENLALLETIPEVLLAVFSDYDSLKDGLSLNAPLKLKLESFLKNAMHLYSEDFSKISTTLNLVDFIQLCARLAPSAGDWNEFYKTRDVLSNIIKYLTLQSEGNEALSSTKENQFNGKLQTINDVIKKARLLFIESYSHKSSLGSLEVKHILVQWFSLVSLRFTRLERIHLDEIILKFEKMIKEELEKNLTSLNEAMKIVYPKSTGDWQGSFPLYNSDGNTSIDIFEGVLRKNKKTYGLLPPKLEACYKLVTDAPCTLNFFSSKFDAKSEDGKIKLSLKGMFEAAFIKINKSWFRLFNAKVGENPLVPLYGSPLRFRIPEEGSSDKFWMGKADEPHRYEMKFVNSAKKATEYTIKDLKTNFLLLKLNTRELKKLPWQIQEFLKVEKANCLRIWIDGDNPSILRSIDLPNYNLTFHYENGNFLVRGSSEFEGLKLVRVDTSLFSFFPHYLILEKTNGKRVLILPNAEFRFTRAREDEPVYHVPELNYWSIKRKEAPFLSYELNDDKIVSHSIKDQIQLSLIRIMSREFELAFLELKKCWKDTPYNQEELEFFNRIDGALSAEGNYFSQMPAFFSFSVYKDWLFIQNKTLDQLAPEVLDEFKERITTGYFCYLQHFNAIDLKIPLREEYQILGQLKVWDEDAEGSFLKNHEKVLAYNRIQTLAGEKNKFVWLTKANTESWMSDLKQYLFQSIPVETINALKDLKSIPNVPFGPVRPKIELPSNFMHLAERILSNDAFQRDQALCDLLFTELKLDGNGAPSLYDEFHAFKLLLFIHLFREKMDASISSQMSIQQRLHHLMDNFNHLLPAFEKEFIRQFEFSENAERSLSDAFINFPIISPPLFGQTLCLPPMDTQPIYGPEVPFSMHEPLEITPLKTLFELHFERLAKNLERNPFPLEALSQSSWMRGLPLAMHSFKEMRGQFNLLAFKEIRWKADKNQTLSALAIELDKRIEKLRITADGSQEEIERMVNSTPLDAEGTITIKELQKVVSKQLAIASKKEKRITYADCRYAQIRRDYQCLQKRNKYLSRNSVEQIFEKQAKTSWILLELRQAKKCRHLVDDLLKATGAKEKQLLSIFSNEMTFDNDLQMIRTHPFLLAYQEITHNFRSNQKEIIIRALENRSSHFFFQLMMGEGKTHIIMPALAYLLADGISIPLMIIPVTHYAQTLHDLKATTELQNGQHVYEFLFVRNSDCTIEALARLKKILEESQKERGCLITTLESIQGLFLAFLDYSRLVTKPGKQSNLEVQHLRNVLLDIMMMLSTLGVGIGEEAQAILQVFKELNFTLGKKTVSIPRDRWQITMEIFKVLSEEFDLFLQTSLGRSYEKTGPDWALVKRTLVDRLVDRIFPVTYDTWQEDWREPTIAYLSATNQKTDFLNEVAKCDPSLANDIVRAKEQLNNFLPHSFSKDIQVSYGMKPPLEIAVPYIGNNVPSVNSEFGHPYIVQNFSIQMYLKLGLSFDQFHQWLSLLKKQMARELGSMQEILTGSTASFFQEEVFNGEVQIRNINLNDTKKLTAFYDRYRKHPKIIFHYLETVAMNEIKVEKRILASNPLDVTDIVLKKFITFTGTPYNLLTYAEKLIENAMLDTSTITELLETLSDPKNQAAHVVKDTNYESLLQEIKKSIDENPNFTVLNDLGAFFQGIKNLKVAKSLMELLPSSFRGVVFYEDESNELVTLMRDGKLYPFNPDLIIESERFTYLDQLRAFGADVPQSFNAHQIITYNKENMFHEILQGAMRNRLLKYGQTVSYLISEKDAAHVRSAIQIREEDSLKGNHLLMNGFIVENNRLVQEIVVSTMQKIQHVYRKKLFTNTMFKIEINDRLSLNEAKYFLHRFFIQTPEDNPMKQYREFEQKISPFEFLMVFSKSLGDLQVGGGLSAEDYKQVFSIITSACLNLPETISGNLFSSLSKEIQKQEEKSILRETLISHGGTYHAFNEVKWDFFTIFDQNTYCASPIGEVDAVDQTLSPQFFSLNQWLAKVGVSMTFNADILMTQNFIKTFKERSDSLEAPLKSISYFLEVCLEDKFYTLLISLKEANKLQTFLSSSPCPTNVSGVKHVVLNDMSGNALSSWGELSEFRQFILEEHIKTIRAQLSYFDGKEFVPQELENPVSEWLGAQDSEEAWRNFEKLHKSRSKDGPFGEGNLYHLLLHKRKREGQAHRNLPLPKRRRVVGAFQDVATSVSAILPARDKGKERLRD